MQLKRARCTFNAAKVVRRNRDKIAESFVVAMGRVVTPWRDGS
jgi:hypothetical protein